MTFSNIGLQEPSTITARVATVTIPRGSTNEQQEIMVVGDPTSSLGVARVLGATPASTEFALAVREVEKTTAITGNVSVQPVAGSTWRVNPGDTNWASSAGFHFNSSGDLKVEVSAYSTIVSVAAMPAGSTSVTVSAWGAGLISSGVAAGNSSAVTVRNVWSSTNADQPVSAAQAGTWNVGTVTTVTTVSSLAGIVAVRPSDTNWASSAGFHFTSSGELNVSGTFSASTTVNVSSLAGRVATAPNDTLWASSAGFHFTSSGELQIAGTFSASTTVQVSSLAGRVTVAPTDTNWASSAGFHFTSSGELIISPVSISGFSTQVAVSSVAGRVTTAPNDTNWASSAGFHFNSSGELLTVAAVTTSTIVSIGAGNSSVIVTSGNSSVSLFQIAAAYLSSGVSAGNSSALMVRNVWSSTNTDQPVSAAQSGTWTISSLGGIVDVAPTDTNWASSAGFHFNSSGDLKVEVSAWSTIVSVANNVSVQPVAGSTWKVGPGDTNWASSAGFHFDSSGALLVNQIGPVSTSAPSSNSSAVIVRPVIDSLLSIASTNLFSSSLFVINSTATGQKCKVYAYTFTSTVGTATKLSFYDGSSVIWPIMLAALSSGVTGVNLAVSPPAYLFAATAGSSVTLRTPSSIAGFKGAISYFMAP